MSTKRDADYYRRIGRKGGLATYKKYGSSYMSRIGKKGWLATTTRYFRSELEHKMYLIEMGLFNYWKSTNLPMKYDKNGLPVWPSQPPIHPAHSNYTHF